MYFRIVGLARKIILTAERVYSPDGIRLSKVRAYPSEPEKNYVLHHPWYIEMQMRWYEDDGGDSANVRTAGGREQSSL